MIISNNCDEDLEINNYSALPTIVTRDEYGTETRFTFETKEQVQKVIDALTKEIK
jgi:hypothetical protein